MRKSRIIVLMGGTAVGKDTVRNLMLKQGEYHSVISYTTRPRRVEETDGVDYHFISDEEMDQKIKGALEHTEYTVNGELYRYCLTTDLFSDELDNIVIINPIGLKQIITNYPELKERLVVIHLTLYRDIVRKRYYDREARNSDTNELIVKLGQRLERDAIDFKDLDLYLEENNIKHYKYFNYNSYDTLKEINRDLALSCDVVIGKTIRIVDMRGEPSYNGKVGVIEYIDDFGQIHGSWGSLAVVPNEDLFEEV